MTIWNPAARRSSQDRTGRSAGGAPRSWHQGSRARRAYFDRYSVQFTPQRACNIW